MIQANRERNKESDLTNKELASLLGVSSCLWTAYPRPC